MKIPFKTLLLAGSVIGAAFLGCAPSTMAQPSGFSFRVGDVAFGYTDGYYDRNRRWHTWSARERTWYSRNYRTNYRAMRHDRDRDGIANRFDRDRDNDGVPNRFDSRPNNPTRR